MTLENCQLFRPSFTNRGTGFTINNEREKDLIKNEVASTNFFPNTITKPSFIKSAKSSDALKVKVIVNFTLSYIHMYIYGSASAGQEFWQLLSLFFKSWTLTYVSIILEFR